MNELNTVLSLIAQQQGSEDLLSVNPNIALPHAPEQHPNVMPWCDEVLNAFYTGYGALPFSHSEGDLTRSQIEALAQNPEVKACLCNQNPQQAFDLGIDCRV